jgi:hypothetical protein
VLIWHFWGRKTGKNRHLESMETAKTGKFWYFFIRKLSFKCHCGTKFLISIYLRIDIR